MWIGTSDIDCYYGDEYGPKKGKGMKDKNILGAQFRNNIFLQQDKDGSGMYSHEGIP